MLEEKVYCNEISLCTLHLCIQFAFFLLYTTHVTFFSVLSVFLAFVLYLLPCLSNIIFYFIYLGTNN